jgi:hypothetical protein
MTGKKTYKEIDTETKLGKKKFLERKVQDQEAFQEIEDYIEHPDQERPWDDLRGE